MIYDNNNNKLYLKKMQLQNQFSINILTLGILFYFFLYATNISDCTYVKYISTDNGKTSIC